MVHADPNGFLYATIDGSDPKTSQTAFFVQGTSLAVQITIPVS